MKTKSSTTFIFLFFCYAFCFGQTASDSMIVKNINRLEWHPKTTLPPGALSAVVYGDPPKGHYDFYAKFPKNYTVPIHWHTFECNVIIIKGSMTIKRDNAADITITQGGFFTLPAKMKYIAYTPNECIFLAHGEKPFDIFYENPKDDPRNH